MQKLKIIILVLALMSIGLTQAPVVSDVSPNSAIYGQDTYLNITAYDEDGINSCSICLDEYWPACLSPQPTQLVKGDEFFGVYQFIIPYYFRVPGEVHAYGRCEDTTGERGWGSDIIINVNSEVDEKVLTPFCWVDADRFGFVKLEAYVAYQNNGFYCHDTSVNAQVGNNIYNTRKHVNCMFSTYVQMPIGVHEVTFSAEYPNLGTKQASCLVRVTESPELALIVKSPKNGSIYETDDSILVEAVGVIINRNVEGADVSAQIYSGNNIINSIELSPKYPSEYSGNIEINASDGEYDLIVTMVYGEYVKSKTIEITVDNSGTWVIPPGGSRINILYPSQNQVFAINSTVPLEIEFLDSNMRMIEDADVTAIISKNGEEIAEESMTERQYTYWLSYKFESAGNYVVDFHAVKDNLEDEKTLYLSIGLPSEIAQALNFTVQILIPQSDTYAEESQIITRARVRVEGEPVVNASVILQLEDNEYDMEYDQFGEYTYIIGPLGIGMYEIRVIASYTNLIAEDSVIFFISEHTLNVELIEPEDGQEVNLNLGDQMPLKVDVRDERGDIVSGALVLVEIINPDSMTTEMQLFQDPETGIYKSVFYPDKEGIHRMTTTSSKAGYVGKIMDSTFKITLKEEGFFPLRISWQTLLTLIIGVAIAILVIGILRMMI